MYDFTFIGKIISQEMCIELSTYFETAQLWVGNVMKQLLHICIKLANIDSPQNDVGCCPAAGAENHLQTRDLMLIIIFLLMYTHTHRREKFQNKTKNNFA